MIPKVSILIPCYNAERWINQAIETSLSQTYSHKEVIVIDDGSTDKSLEIIKSFGSAIRLENHPNQGGNATRNKLLMLSTGDWLQYLDADDYLLPNKIQTQVDFLSLTPHTDIICSPAIAEYHQDGQVYRRSGPALQPRNPWILLSQWYLPQTGGCLWRKQALVDVGGWRTDQLCCQEHELYLRLLIAGKNFSFFDESGAIYRLWDNSTVSRKDVWQVYRYRLKIKEDIEFHLKSINQLTEELVNIINQTRFDCARRIYDHDSAWSEQILADIYASLPSFSPRHLPLAYRTLYQILGFSLTEKIARIRRYYRFPGIEV